jgi:hypothetical protein
VVLNASTGHASRFGVTIGDVAASGWPVGRDACSGTTLARRPALVCHGVMESLQGVRCNPVFYCANRFSVTKRVRIGNKFLVRSFLQYDFFKRIKIVKKNPARALTAEAAQSLQPLVLVGGCAKLFTLFRSLHGHVRPLGVIYLA